MAIEFRNYFYYLSKIKANKYFIMYEETPTHISFTKRFHSSIEGVKEFTIAFNFKKHSNDYLIFSDISIIYCSRSLGYTLRNKIYDYVMKNIPSLLTPFKVRAIDKDGNITVANLGRDMPVISKSEIEGFFDDLELLISYVPPSSKIASENNKSDYYSLNCPRFNIYYSEKMKKLVYEYPELLKLSRNIDESKIELILEKDFSFLSHYVTNKKITDFFLTKNGLYLTMNYDFETLKQFNLFKIEKYEFMKESVVKILFSPNGNFDKNSNSLLNIAEMYKEHYMNFKGNDTSDDYIIHFDKKFFIKVLEGDKVKNYNNFKFYSEKIFSHHKSEFSKGDFLAISNNGSVFNGIFLEPKTDTTSNVMVFGRSLSFAEVNNSVLDKSDDVFKPITEEKIAVFKSDIDSLIIGKVIEENNLYYRIFLPNHNVSIETDNENFIQRNYFFYGQSNLKTYLNEFLFEKYKGFLFTIPKAEFDGEDSFLLSHERYKLFNKVLENGYPSSEMFNAVFERINIHRFNFVIFNLLCHAHMEKFGIEKTIIELVKSQTTENDRYKKEMNSLFEKLFNSIVEGV